MIFFRLSVICRQKRGYTCLRYVYMGDKSHHDGKAVSHTMRAAGLVKANVTRLDTLGHPHRDGTTIERTPDSSAHHRLSGRQRAIRHSTYDNACNLFFCNPSPSVKRQNEDPSSKQSSIEKTTFTRRSTSGHRQCTEQCRCCKRESSVTVLMRYCTVCGARGQLTGTRGRSRPWRTRHRRNRGLRYCQLSSVPPVLIVPVFERSGTWSTYRRSAICQLQSSFKRMDKRSFLQVHHSIYVMCKTHHADLEGVVTTDGTCVELALEVKAFILFHPSPYPIHQI